MALGLRPADSGRQLRLGRLTRHHWDSVFLVPLDHSVASGPIASADGVEAIVRAVAEHGGDGVILHKGRARFVPPDLFRALALVVHMNASTMHAADADEKVLVTGIEEALRLGADAVSLQVNLGSRTESRQLGDLGAVADVCHRWGMPLMAMIYPRGPQIADPSAPNLVGHAASLAADLGADIVKTPYTGSVATMAEVIRTCPIPVIVAGGAALDSEEDLISQVDAIMRSGAKGVAIGRNVFASPDVAGTVRRIARVVHAPYRRVGDQRYGDQMPPWSHGQPSSQRAPRAFVASHHEYTAREVRLP
jgi:2-amino-4,5-dihydroxy-6-oxo-7-(phosphooxy)heptanoate synthase